ncbi:MAG: sulfite exporter TauE/SafE family protein [Salinivirgaceae bacterium]|nr:sulfite exporter TauE/SafE family protein [Salinivirgaceae bacterium]
MNEIIILIFIGLLAGFVGGMMGVGGGVVVIPALVFILGFTQHEAQGTAQLFMLPPIGIFAVWNYYKADYVNVKYGLILAAAFVIGAYVGSIISVELPDKILKKLFGFMLLYAAYRMLFK